MRVPDQSDLATYHEEQNLKHALNAQKSARSPELPEVGRCYNCGERITKGLFCPPFEAAVSECLTDWQLRQRAVAMRKVEG